MPTRSPISTISAVAISATVSEIARAVDHAGEHVAADLVDAEECASRARPGGQAEVVERVRVLRRSGPARRRLDDQRREDRDQDQQDDEAERRHRDLVATEAAPEQLQRRARRDLALFAGEDLFGRDAEPSEWSSSLVPVLMRRPPLGSVLRYPVRNPPCEWRAPTHARTPDAPPGPALSTGPRHCPLEARNPTRPSRHSARSAYRRV